MKRGALNKWLKALRSKKYKPTSGALKDSKGHCALGVLCDISEVGEWKTQKDSTRMKYLGQDKYLPKEVEKWAGMSRQEAGDVMAFLIAYNDIKKLSFEEIAKLLENSYKIKKD